MKRIIGFVLMLALLICMSAPAFAENDVVIQAVVSEEYSIKIPAATTDLTYGVTTAQTFGTVGLSKARLEPGHQITITVSGNDGLANSIDGTKKITYSIMDGSSVFTSASFTDTTLKTLTIIVAEEQWNAAPAGSYSDTVTFTSAVTDINS